jgi:hypothetical protein
VEVVRSEGNALHGGPSSQGARDLSVAPCGRNFPREDQPRGAGGDGRNDPPAREFFHEQIQKFGIHPVQREPGSPPLVVERGAARLTGAKFCGVVNFEGLPRSIGCAFGNSAAFFNRILNLALRLSNFDQTRMIARCRLNGIWD